MKERVTETHAGEWRETTLGEVLTLQRGFDLPKSKRLPGPHPVIASTGPVGTHRTASVQGPGVLIGRSGSLGGGQFITSDFWPLNTTLWVKDFQGNDRRFCYYLLKSLDLAQFNAGSGVPTLNRNHIHPLPVRVPPRSEQRAIAHILGTLDDKIELNRRMNQTLEEMARALFQSWFVDFDPVRAKAALKQHAVKRPSAYAGKSNSNGAAPAVEWTNERASAYLDAMDPTIVSLFPDRLVKTELGDMPEGWKAKPLSNCVNVARGLSYKGSGLSADGMPMHNLNSIYEGGGYKNDGIKYYTGDFQQRHTVEPGDVLVANTEQGHNRLLIGFSAVVPDRFRDKGLFSHHIYRLQSKIHAGLTPDFLCHLLNTTIMHGHC